MSETINNMEKNYQPAFPVDIRLQNQGEEMQWYFGPGLSKREYFAAKSLQGLLAYSEYTPELTDEDMVEDSENGKWCKYYGYWVSQEGGNTHALVTTFEQRMARVAVKYADALLAELEK